MCFGNYLFRVFVCNVLYFYDFCLSIIILNHFITYE